MEAHAPPYLIPGRESINQLSVDTNIKKGGMLYFIFTKTWLSDRAETGPVCVGINNEGVWMYTLLERAVKLILIY